jgi:adenosylcobinamide kinase/adenosylcobinamide-phosphate guanylyltransferase
MAARIADHRKRRGSGWRTVEEPLALPAVLAAEAGEGRAVLADCLTLWLSNLMAAGRDIDVETDALIAALMAAAGPVVIVANEVGSGVMPANALARRFADAHGILNQRVAATVGRVVLMAAGLPVPIKPAREFAL